MAPPCQSSVDYLFTEDPFKNLGRMLYNARLQIVSKSWGGVDFNLAPPNLVCYPAGLVWIERFALPLKCEKHRISLIFSVLHRLSALGCGATRNRTGDTRIFSPLLYQLSYGTNFNVCNIENLHYCLFPFCECKVSNIFLFCKIFRNFLLIILLDSASEIY